MLALQFASFLLQAGGVEEGEWDPDRPKDGILSLPSVLQWSWRAGGVEEGEWDPDRPKDGFFGTQLLSCVVIAAPEG